MIKATYSDKARVVDILSQSFVESKSIEQAVKQGPKRLQRIRNLMEYSFEVCWHWGEVYLSDNGRGAVLVLPSHNKGVSLKALWLDLKVVIQAIGVKRVIQVMKKERYLKKMRFQTPYLYVWSMAVIPGFRGQGAFMDLKEGIFQMADERNVPVYVETSGERQKKVYVRFGFEVYHTYKVKGRNPFVLYFLRRYATPYASQVG